MNRRDFLSKKYDELYEQASGVVRKHNPCKITDGKCAAKRSIANGLCCKECPHLGPDGCTTKSLGCKIWLCTFDTFCCPSMEVASPYWEDMITILKEAEKYALSLPRSGKEVTISLALTGSHRGCRQPWDEHGPRYPSEYDLRFRDNQYYAKFV